jgi:hypothetical protein
MRHPRTAGGAHRRFHQLHTQPAFAELGLRELIVGACPAECVGAAKSATTIMNIAAIRD